MIERGNLQAPRPLKKENPVKEDEEVWGSHSTITSGRKLLLSQWKGLKEKKMCPWDKREQEGCRGFQS